MSLFNRAFGWVLRRRARVAEQYVRREMPEMWQAIETTRQAGGLSHGMQPLRLRELSRLLERFAPDTVLECGSGTTTALFARMCTGDGRGPSVISLEESAHWQEVTRRLVPDDLQPRVEFRLAARVLETIGGTRVARYDIAYDREYDFVYVDGPSGHDPDDRRPGVKLPLVDAWCLIRAGFPPKVIAVDSKRHSIAFFRSQHIERLYRMELQSRLIAPAKALFTPYRHHTVFIRK